MKANVYFLKDKQSSRFAKRFRELISEGHCPICLPSSLSDQQVKTYLTQYPDYGFYDGDELLKESTGSADYENCYGTLTSGTTSKPKICFLNCNRAKANAQVHGESLNLNSDLTILQALPIYHSFGIMNYIWLPEVMNMNICFHDGMLGLKTINKLEKENLYLAISPSQLRFFLKEKISSTSIRVLSVGGGLARKDELIQIKDKLQCDVYVTYGLSEAGPRVSTALVDTHYVDGSLGSALKGITLKQNEDETLLIKTPYEKLNISPEEKNGDYLITRDVVDLKDGEILFKNRKDDLIDFGGVSIYPQDIENVALGLEDVIDAIVLAKKHKIHGEVPILFVETNSSLTSEQFDHLLIDKILPYQRPHEIICLPSLPRTSLGKVDRKKLIGEYL